MRSTAPVFLLWLAFSSFANAQGDLAALLQTQPELSTLLDLATLAGVNETLSTSSNITIFAPTNEAFEALLQLEVPESEAVRNRNVTTVRALLDNHVFRGYHPSSSIGDVPTFVQSFVTPDQRNDVQPFTSIQGGQYNGLVKNGNDVNVISGELAVANVTMADIPLGEGITIHVIDQTLNFGPPLELFLARAEERGLNGALTTAQSAGGLNFTLGIDGSNSGVSPLSDITVFIPIDEAFENIASVLETADLPTLVDVIEYHFLNNNIVFSPSLSNTSVPPFQGADLTVSVLKDGSIFVNDAKVIFPNVILSNGVAHIIDSVLNPLNTTFSREDIDADSPASERVQFASATSASTLPFTTFTFTFAEAESYTTPAILSTYPAVSLPTTFANATATTTPSATIVPYTGGAADLMRPCATAMAAMAGGFVVGML
ncbi:Fasciclin-like arabinogalactan protein [Pseudocercospora fuligena]|uniref:Fasciclin-like arabinogalactan protein n=1 Tax=Pseudocercospora fuligena TaxID=685502 RepID=A0A8H6VHW9_9PEZI|nr:Fasciclin-like arabinogalactan protein [Pseudocercospora fuligena]